MVPLTQEAHDLVQGCLSPGDTAIDATAGNGHDALFLATTVGELGHVFAIDVQPAACAACQQRVSAAGQTNVQVIHGDHAQFEQLIPGEYRGKVAAVMFNLGYLPGGDKTIVTTAERTVRALAHSLEWLRDGGILCIIAYRGHPGGREEAAAVEAWLRERESEGHLRLTCATFSESQTPVLLALQKG
ncbi:class I SAM-dependent methyltransferase [Planctomicrobium piriforme]|uniref:Putative rRNA methylase n=1 Tax=Planctomicrobium piriforme TaxID=1576369 RepID=A0A1I3IZS0_9PLAN|nr:class I SAM-dependent methyltransferase [Planctomicrobium piriforme]SFI53439.1 Putative rRNA methylase [Planctomicrobium piriforme]